MTAPEPKLDSTQAPNGFEQLARASRDFLLGFRDLLYPRDCLVEQRVVEDSDFDFLSTSGLRGLTHARAPQCHTCGFPYFGEMLSARTCPHCQELEPAFDAGRTLLLARETGRVLVHELKYRQGHYLLPDIRRLLVSRPDFLAFLEGGILVPVPLFHKRERRRRFNQSLVLAQTMAEAAGGLPIEDLLQRTRDTPSQTRLNRKQRYENVKNAFALKENAVLALHQRYILVDDVFTTGATLNACAVAMRRAGATHLAVATLAHG